MKKIITYIIAAYFVVQLAIPGFLVFRHYDTLHTGEGYKFVVEPYDPYDPFRGRYVALNTELPLYSSEGEYIQLGRDEDGYARLDAWSVEKPGGDAYAKNLRLDRYYMNEKLAPEAERIQRELDLTVHTMHLLVKVKRGHYVIEGLYVDDVPIEQYITSQST